MRLTVAIAVVALLAGAAAPVQSQDSSFIAVDENLWVAFYDVPSRRFRAIRDAFVRRDFESVSRDLVTAASHLMIETERAPTVLVERFAEVTSQMTAIAANAGDANVTSSTLDTLFARAHWLLSQSYLHHARQSRDAADLRMAGRYLWATTHHMERAALWSNARISRRLVATLDNLRELALRLQDSTDAGAARKEKPIVKAEQLLLELGEQIDRPVLIKVE